MVENTAMNKELYNKKNVRYTFNLLTPNNLKGRRAVSRLKIKISSKNLGRQPCAEGFNPLTPNDLKRRRAVNRLKIKISSKKNLAGSLARRDLTI
jgi:phage gp16-like protein